MNIPQNNGSATHGFSAYKNYLLGFSYLLNHQYSSYAELKNAISPIFRNTSANEERIRSLLFNSWNSEMLLNLPLFLPQDFIKFSNHWSPVQSYYAIYLSLRALIVAKNMQTSGDHAKTLQVCVSNFIEGQHLFPKPWNLLCLNEGYGNLPSGYVLPEINALENPAYFRKEENKLLANACMFVRTTRDRIIEERCEEWKEENPTKNGTVRSRLPNGQRDQIAAGVRSVSVFDAFYRLRIRSNYKDVDIFLGSDTNDAKTYLRALCNITDKTLFMIEAYVAQAVGKAQFGKMYGEYVNSINIGIVLEGQVGIVKRAGSHLR